MFRDRVAQIGVHLHHVARGKVFRGVEKRKCPLFLRQIDGGEIGRPRDAVHPVLCLLRGRFGPVAQADHQERIGQPGDAKADPALGLRLRRLLGQRKARGIDGVVHHPDRHPHQIVKRVLIQRRTLAERVPDQPGEVHRPQKTGAIGRQRLLPAGVGGGDGFGIGQIVHPVDAVDEDHARFGIVVGRTHDLVPQIARVQRVIDLAFECQFPRAVGLDRLHEGIGDEDRQVEHAQPRGVLLGLDKAFDVGVIAAHRRHHRAPATARRHDRPAHCVPDIHEAQGAGGIGGHALHLRAPRPDGGEVIADPATLLHGQRGLFQPVEDAAHVVGDRPHDEAVEKRDRPPRPRARRDTSGGEVFEILKRCIESSLPRRRVLFDRGERAGDAAPAILDGRIDGGAVRLFQAVFHVPDLLGDRGGETGHRFSNSIIFLLWLGCPAEYRPVVSGHGVERESLKALNDLQERERTFRNRPTLSAKRLLNHRHQRVVVI